MKKIITTALLAGTLMAPSVSQAIASGACSSHGGVNCSKISSTSYVICNDGWTGSSVKFLDGCTDDAVSRSVELPEGALIRAQGSIDVFIVKYKNGKKFKRLILSPSVFNSYGHLKWENILDIHAATVESFTTSGLVRAVGDDTVYMLYPQGDTGEKKHIQDAGVFARMNLDPDAIYEINTVDRDSYLTGMTLQ